MCGTRSSTDWLCRVAGQFFAVLCVVVSCIWGCRCSASLVSPPPFPPHRLSFACFLRRRVISYTICLARVARENASSVIQGTIKSRLLSMSYTTPEDFASDVRLVFTNAIGFNPESHFVHTWAVQLLSEFDVSVCVYGT